MQQMVENQVPVARSILRLLADHPEGLSVLELARKLDSDARQIKLALVSLQSSNKISSGLRKLENEYTFFERYYFSA
ncbi:hypothetical protein GF412_01725 [Candidatus Micrarchaeota archaeon]|nr:hypothetical protein [Candidatus Micrarchaeota archaeon]MBD3417681.1 hypothetical protein [Candidatus Micrarchaeota archaeon]